MRKFSLLIIILLLAINSGNSQIFHKNPEKALFGKSIGTKQVKVKEPRKVTKAKRKQEAKDKKLKKEYQKSVNKSRKRTVDIQSAEVQKRMKQDKKNITKREKVKKKGKKSGSKKARKKYK
jgi:hypothetical protein